MLYVRFMYPDGGWDSDIEHSKKAGLKVGERYEVEYISMGSWYTDVHLKDFKGHFNSVQFEFEEDDTPINIYDNPKYNPYI